MKYEEIETRVDELEEVDKILKGTLDRARVEYAESQIEVRFTKQLGEMDSFITGIINATKSATSQEEVAVSLLGGINKLQEYVRDDSQRLRDRVPVMKERIAVLESLHGFVETRKKSHVSRKEAIERVASEGETSRPERIPVVREAEKLRKTRKQDDS